MIRKTMLSAATEINHAPRIARRIDAASLLYIYKKTIHGGLYLLAIG
jgi:hypothetical protein